MLAVNRKLKARPIENEAWSCLEQVWIAIKLSDRTLFLGVIYIPPDRVRDHEVVDAHCRSVREITDNADAIDEIVVLGDFNMPGIFWQPSSNGFLYPDPEHSTFHPAATSLLDSYSTATLMQINNVVNENNRKTIRQHA